MTVDAAARRVYVSHSTTQVDVLDADSFAVVGTIPNTPRVHGVAIAPEAGRGYISAGKADVAIASDLKTLDRNLYVNLEEQNETLRIDVNAMKVKDRWPLAPCATPTSLAMDIENRRLFVGCRSKHFAVVNADTGKIILTAPIGERVDAGAFDPKTHLVYFSTGDGKVFVFHQDSADKYSVVQEITTKPGAKTMGYDFHTRNLFVPNLSGAARPRA